MPSTCCLFAKAFPFVQRVNGGNLPAGDVQLRLDRLPPFGWFSAPRTVSESPIFSAEFVMFTPSTRSAITHIESFSDSQPTEIGLTYIQRNILK